MLGIRQKLAALGSDPLPDWAFELSEEGVAWARPQLADASGFYRFEQAVLQVSPLRDNVVDTEMLASAISRLTGPSAGRSRKNGVLILPDFCARFAVLDFESFPADPQEQLALVRFRMKKSVPFDVESAVVRYYAQPVGSDKKRFEVLVTLASLDIVARYEAPFRAAGLQLGVVTPSCLAAAEMNREPGISVIAKLSGRAMTITVNQDAVIKLIRAVEMAEISNNEFMNVLFPTVAFVEDELGERPARLLHCGFGEFAQQHGLQWQTELGIAVEPLRGRSGIPQAHNAGLAGYLESLAA